MNKLIQVVREFFATSPCPEDMQGFFDALEAEYAAKQRDAQPVAVDGMPERMAKPDQWDDEYERGEIKGHNACHDAFTAWLSKATDKFEIARHSKRLVEKLRAEVTEQALYAASEARRAVEAEAERDALRAENARLHERVREEQAYVSELAAESTELSTANAELVEALRKIADWPDGGATYGQERIKKFASDALLASAGGGDAQ